MLITVVRGHTREAQRAFRTVRHEAEITVGSRGDWEVTGPGVVALHLRLRFSAGQLYAARADGSVLLGGRPLEPTWTAVHDGDELRFGFAMLRISEDDVRAGSSPPVATDRERSRWGWAIAGGAVVLVGLVALAILSGKRSSDSSARRSTGPGASASLNAAVPTLSASSGPAPTQPLQPPIDETPAPLLTLSRAEANDVGTPRLDPAIPEKLPAAFPQNIANRPIPRIGDKPWLISDEWREHHERLLRAAGRANAKLIFVGDSITEGWWSAPAYKEYFGKYAPLNLGIASDTTQNVLWRIEHGALDGTHPRAVVAMVGINNLAGGFSPQDTAGGLRAIVAAIQKHLPEARVLLLAVLPARRDVADPLRQRIQECNQLLLQLVQPGRVDVLDLGSVLLEADGSISKTVLRDYLHPTPEGYEKLSEALAPHVAQLVGG